MTEREAVALMIQAREHSQHSSDGHEEADEILRTFVLELGYVGLVAEFDEVRRNYP